VGALGHTLFTQHSFRATSGGLNTWTTQNIVTNIERRLVNYESHMLKDNYFKEVLLMEFHKI
jgi:hypothetical protein